MSDDTYCGHCGAGKGWLRLERACAGLTLPADVPEGAVARLVEEALALKPQVFAIGVHARRFDMQNGGGEVERFLDAVYALRDLGIGDTK